MDVAPTMPGLNLACRPAREGHMLVFEYALSNLEAQDVYVHDALPTVDRASKVASANPKAVSIIHSPAGDAIIGKFIPPMPATLRPAIPITPLAYRLAVGETMKRRLEVPEPLAETSPYLPDLLLRQYEVVDVNAVVFMVGYWRAGGKGFGIAPSPYAEGLFSVILAGGVSGAGTMLVSQRFATRGLQIFRRTDAFPRTVAA